VQRSTRTQIRGVDGNRDDQRWPANSL
jgi:hypothetical protein